MSPGIMSGTASDRSLPFELIESILSRLPVKSLKRFRAVEKSWLSLIDSEDFAKMHFHRSLQANSNRCLISGVLGFYRLGLDSLDDAESFEPGFRYNLNDGFSVSNVCNGLVVVKRDPYPPVLWNPFTRDHKVLPECPCLDFPAVYPSLSCKTTYGFGYDSKNDDYKLVKVMLYETPASFLFSEEWIYGLKSDCWRRTKGTHYDKGEWPTHVDGVLHTIRYSESGLGRLEILGFSVVTEKDYELVMPEGTGIGVEGLVYVVLDVFDGCLAVVSNYGSTFNLWVMEEYGVKKSWKILMSFPADPKRFVRPIVYSKDSDKFLLKFSSKTITVCGLRTGDVKNFTMPFMYSPKLCVETLISPNGWNKRNDMKKSLTEKQNKDGEPNKEKKKTMKKKRDGFLSSGFKLVL